MWLPRILRLSNQVISGQWLSLHLCWCHAETEECDIYSIFSRTTRLPDSISISSFGGLEAWVRLWATDANRGQRMLSIQNGAQNLQRMDRNEPNVFEKRVVSSFMWRASNVGFHLPKDMRACHSGSGSKDWGSVSCSVSRHFSRHSLLSDGLNCDWLLSGWRGSWTGKTVARRFTLSLKSDQFNISPAASPDT